MTDRMTMPAASPKGGVWEWTGSLGYVREAGWVGSVCAAVARRVGVDPVVVRGAFVVAALLGFPALWLYAIAWAVLPDGEGRIPLRFDEGARTSLAGALVTAGLAMISTITTVAVLGVVGHALGGGGFTAMLMAVLLLAAVGAVAALVVWMTRRPAQTPRGDRLPVTEGETAAPSLRGGVILTSALVAVAVVLVGMVWLFVTGDAFAAIILVLLALTAGSAVLAIHLVRRRTPRPVGHRPAGGRIAIAVVLTAVIAVVSLVLIWTTVNALAWSSGPFVGFAMATCTILVAVVAALGLWALWRWTTPRAALPRGALEEAAGAYADSGPAGDTAAPPFPERLPPPAPAVHDDDAAQSWRARQEAWRAEHDAWRRQQTDGDRLAREEDRVRRREEARSFAVEAARLRELRRAGRPRISFAYGAAAFGLALIAASAVALAVMNDGSWGDTLTRSLAATVAALFAAGLVSAVAMVLAGALRRRSGFLAFLTVTFTLLGGVVLGGSILGTGAGEDSATVVISGNHGFTVGAGSHELTQILGEMNVHVWSEGGGSGEAIIRRGDGSTTIVVPPDVDFSFTGEVGSGDVLVQPMAGDWTPLGGSEVVAPQPGDGVVTWQREALDEPAGIRAVELTQRAGWVQILDFQEELR
jgi:phage shock protein PspC (stress-responsive transcriptional regulator)